MLPSFETQRLLVRPRTMVDFEACLVMDRDVEVTKHIPGPWHDPEQHEAFVRRRMQADYGPGLGYGTVVEKHQPNRFLGWILLIPADGIGPEIEIGWRLVREAWGRGYATEAAMPVIRYAFTTLKADRIMAEIAPRNTASLRVAQKLGLSDAGVRDDQGAIWRRYQMTQSDFASLEETGR